jgi:hypothetical protein
VTFSILCFDFNNQILRISVTLCELFILFQSLKLILVCTEKTDAIKPVIQFASPLEDAAYQLTMLFKSLLREQQLTGNHISRLDKKILPRNRITNDFQFFAKFQFAS